MGSNNAMHSSRLYNLLAKTFAAVAILAVAFGPFGAWQKIPIAEAACTQQVDSLGTTHYTGDCGTNGITQVTAQGVATNAQGQKVDASGKVITDECSGITGCLASMVYYIGPGFASWVASLAAYFFNFIVHLSLNSSAYSLTFLADIWNTVLSLANMFFIFILIYAAFVIMFRAETARTMQMLAWVIAIALVVNFSFFFTRVVIDAGNILATQFYNATLTYKDANGNISSVPSINPGVGAASSVPDITAPLMSAIGVDQLLGGGSFEAVSQGLGGTLAASWETLLVFSVVFLFAAAMFWILAIALLMVGIKFFIRVVGLWLVLVGSPLAFVAQTVVGTRKYFQQWLHALVGLSLYPAVFLFMFWMLDKFAGQLGGGVQLLGISGQNGSIINAAQSATPAGQTALVTLIANVSIRMMFIIVLIWVMLKVSDWVIEQAGGMATIAMNRGSAAILGGGFRTAASLGAFAGRNTAGRLGYNFAQSKTGQSLLANSRLGIGTTLWRGASALGRSSFDVRNSQSARSAGGLIGTLSRTRDVDMSRGSQKSREGSVEEQAARVKAEGEALRASPKEIRAVGKDAAKVAERERLNAYLERKTTRNVSNVGMPSMGALKGASALQKALDEERAKEKKRAEKENTKVIKPSVTMTISPSVLTTVGPTTPTTPTPAAPAAALKPVPPTPANMHATMPIYGTVPAAPAVVPAPASTPNTPAPAPATPVPSAPAAQMTQAQQEKALKELGQRFDRIIGDFGKKVLKSHNQLSEKLDESHRQVTEKIESGLNRSDLKTHDQLKKLEKQVAADLAAFKGPPDGDGGGSPPSGAAAKPVVDQPDDEGSEPVSKAA